MIDIRNRVVEKVDAVNRKKLNMTYVCSTIYRKDSVSQTKEQKLWNLCTYIALPVMEVQQF